MRRLFLLLLIPFLLSAGSVQAGTWIENDHRLEAIEIELGLAGHFKLGAWSEMRVTVDAALFDGPPQLSVIALDSDGVPVQTVAPTPEKVDGKLAYRVPVRVGRRDSSVRIEIISGEGSSGQTSLYENRVSELAVPIPADHRWYLQIGPDIGLQNAVQRYAAQLTENTVIVELTDPRQVPEQWFLMEGIDQIIWTANDPVFVAALSSPQLAALEQWLKLGGRLTLSVGAEARELIGASGPLQRFAPGQFVEVLDLRNATELEALVGTAARVDRPLDGALTVAVLSNPKGEIRLREGSRQATYPLWVRSAMGFGVVEFFAFDLSAEPVASWVGREPLLRLLLEAIGDRQQESRVSQQSGRSVAHYGYTDIAGQLRMALDQFPGVRNVSFFLIGAIIVGYLLLIGPGDYFFLRKINRGMEWTWVSFPTIIVLVSLGIWWTATWSKGTDIKLNHVEVLDIDLDARLVRSTSWFHLFSPESKRYDISLDTKTMPADTWNQLVSWQGLAGSGLGGMSARQSINTVPTPYQIDLGGAGEGVQATLDQLPVQVWSSKTLTARGWGELPETAFEPLIEGDSQLIHGPLLNPTDFTLTDCYIFHGRWAYYVRELPPRGTVRIVPGQSAQNTEKVLKRRRVQESTDGGELWDRQSIDIPRIMEVTMFHRAAGGLSYTNLTSRFQSYVDLSSHLQGDRAVLVGRIERPASQVQIDGQPIPDENAQTWSYARIVYPVQRDTPSEITQR